MRNSLYFIGLTSLLFSCGSQKPVQKVEAKPKTIKANFKRGAKVTELKPKDAIELFSKILLADDYQ